MVDSTATTVSPSRSPVPADRFLVEPHRMQGVGPDAGGGGCAEERPDVEPSAQRCVAQDQERPYAVGDEPVDHQGEEIGQKAADVDGDGHLLEGVVRQGAARAAQGDDGHAVPAGDVRGRRRARGTHAAVPKSSRPWRSPSVSGAEWASWPASSSRCTSACRVSRYSFCACSSVILRSQARRSSVRP